ncbi:MAG: hypothetical protein JU82_03210 [Sulfuricurvum sp. MLSB]|uniref:hypothetical protein n=2 Tax=unclassified Sulfuricurvum TaxID=2632390 RepID=UPI0004FFEEE4|nr:hypothetical protein [Sulfuricurvum sp. MLSB]KFN40405.1 MAG: hypothetical protein JU82_03210 [Sulfuricurvum sp. MLSB]
MQEIQPLKVNSYLAHEEIKSTLENVEFIIMAAPSMMAPPALPIHFTIILNTSDPIPEEIKPHIVEKFCREHGITSTSDLIFEAGRIAFAMTAQETPMPRHLIDPAEANTIPWVSLQIIDFLGDAERFKEAKDGLSGWSYSHN